MIEQAIPILEFDDAPDAVIEPSRILQPLAAMPERCVLCFFQDVLSTLFVETGAAIITRLGSEIGKNPVYLYEHEGVQIAVVHAGVGAPLSAAFLEELIALGCRKFIACGGAGVLDSQIAVGHVVVPTSAVRDEGTSYHYLPPGREVTPDADAVAAIIAALEQHHVPYLQAKTWTTDGFYRETRKRVAARKAEGCLTVEMEAAAFFAVAQFRGVQFGQLLYGADDLGGDAWDHRDWQNARLNARDKLFMLAVEAVVRL